MKTRKNVKRTSKKGPKRRRKLPGLYAGNDALDEKFMCLLDSGDQGMDLYIYRAVDNCRDGPYIYKCHPFPELEDFIRDEFGGGEYAVMIRRRSGPFMFSGVVSIGVPLNWKARLA